jgi:hypothetical protein
MNTSFETIGRYVGAAPGKNQMMENAVVKEDTRMGGKFHLLFREKAIQF